MNQTADRAIAVVGVGAVLPDAPNAPAFWKNIRTKRYSITDVPPERWSAADYYDPDPSAPDKTYSKIGAWVRGFQFDWKQFRIPPKVAAAMDESQQWAVTIAAEALADYGYPNRPLNTERTGVILGTAMGGELHYASSLRIFFPEYAHALADAAAFKQLPADVREALMADVREMVHERFPNITEDTMPGELANIVAGRIANVFNLRGPSFITDAACASTFAAVEAAVENLINFRCDAVLTGGVDRNMGANSFVKFSKIGALSASGSRPFGDGADGFVMGEGAAAFERRRARWRQNLRRDSRRRRLQRRQGQRHYGAQSDRPAVSHAARVGKRRARPCQRDVGRSARHQHQGGRCGGSGKPGDHLRQCAGRQHRPRLGQEQHRPSEGRRGRSRSAEGRHGGVRQGAAAHAQCTEAQSEPPFRSHAILRQPRPAGLAAAGPRPTSGRGERVWLWRHEFPCRGGRTCAGRFGSRSGDLCWRERPQQPGAASRQRGRNRGAAGQRRPRHPTRADQDAAARYPGGGRGVAG